MPLPYTSKILGYLLMFFSLAHILPGFLAYFLEETEYVYLIPAGLQRIRELAGV